GYREFPSLIKGGHASFQLDFSNEKIESTETKVHVLICLNHHGLELNLRDLKDGGILIHDTVIWKFSKEEQAHLDARKIKVIYIPLEDILMRLKAKPILGNVLLSAFVWAMMGLEKEALKELVGEKFAKKKALLDLNMQCIDEGFAFTDEKVSKVTVQLPPPESRWKDHLLCTGSQAMGLGAVHAGVRFYAGYPMTPSSPLLSYVADIQNQTGMIIKQAEDEITAAQMVSGAMHMGTRALTGTSGGGFDLMSESLSLNGIIENPAVFVLAQRPGPATGLPTWTAQGDLLMAVNTSHGEFARCVLSVSESQDAFDLMHRAFNIAEEFQCVVIVLTDKQIAEGFYTQAPYDLTQAEIRRGKLVTDPKKLKALKAADRYDPHAPDGVSWRWLPGSEAATYCAQADEHSADGTVEESSENTKLQFEKRMKKLDALKKTLPEPTLFGSRDPEILLVGWGSTKSVVLDALKELNDDRVGYLHFTYLWPLRTEKFEQLAAKAKKVVLIEQNYQGQLGVLLRQECGIKIQDRILKYDGRPFFVDELRSLIESHLSRVNRG
ncbi:MAG: pyruvate flavodoxin/ferredoxin oxidoreductase-like protein, partial [Candidatus Peregrinibacteria bacterium Greene0416_19]